MMRLPRSVSSTVVIESVQGGRGCLHCRAGDGLTIVRRPFRHRRRAAYMSQLGMNSIRLSSRCWRLHAELERDQGMLTRSSETRRRRYCGTQDAECWTVETDAGALCIGPPPPFFFDDIATL